MQNVNIVDMDQKVMQGISVMTVVADFQSAKVTPQKLEKWYRDNAESLAIDFSFLPLEKHQGRRQTAKELYIVTILAKDRPGIIRDVAEVAARNGVNLERASVTARGELISIEFLMDFADCSADDCRSQLKK
jgi:phosphoserine phosphatase